MDVGDFTDACARLHRNGLTIHSARYDGDAFGSWSIDFSAREKRRIVWDGKERRLTLETRDGDAWKETWTARDASEQSLDSLWTQFRSGGD